MEALGAAIRIGIKHDNIRILKPIIIKLRRDERDVSLNEDECNWCNDNGIECDPLDWNEWMNQYPDPASLATEYLRLKGLLTKENKQEYRRIHGGRMQKLQDEADAGKIGGVIRNIVGREPGFLMESLNHEGKTITDGVTIAKLITSFFKN
jgi:hypothetical protein